ncbi:hypothetical protein [Okeania sp. SIO3B5]|uniref:hypothetical protein n=1 Tax=Okeania sp. SIO3B5 TaxID=2607811 RepID=UPI0025EA4832|nr:hypothetical protein [Okeania sp. SIO3B5]
MFVNWLEKMVQINQKDRYPSAGAAKIALQKIDIKNIPVVELNIPTLNFTSTQIDEKLTQIISVTNHIPNDVKTGTWEVAKHPNDSPNFTNNHP